MLRIDNLDATVADKAILKGISPAMNEGEVHAIMGPNGYEIEIWIEHTPPRGASVGEGRP